MGHGTHGEQRALTGGHLPTKGTGASAQGGALGRAGCWRCPGGRAFANNEGLQSFLADGDIQPSFREPVSEAGERGEDSGEAKVLGP